MAGGSTEYIFSIRFEDTATKEKHIWTSSVLSASVDVLFTLTVQKDDEANSAPAILPNRYVS